MNNCYRLTVVFCSYKGKFSVLWSSLLQVADIVKAVGNCSYNQLVEKIISCKQSDNSELVSEGG